MYSVRLNYQSPDVKTDKRQSNHVINNFLNSKSKFIVYNRSLF